MLPRTSERIRGGSFLCGVYTHLSRLGITLSDGMNIFLRQVIMNNGLPFDVRLTGQTQIKSINPTQKLSAEKEKQLALVESSCGAFKDCSFSTERYFAQKKRDKELEP
ncbi:hypothetical protein FACS1894109_19920 [Spirochaetia bacterium]|nr:hypothetical protein FACS1894109_19920 [Spirochaetia bacterium]